jgi:hypothetical protein
MSKNGYYTAFGDFRTVNKVVEHMDPSEDDHDHHDENHDTNHNYIKCPKGYVCIPYDEFDQMMRGMDPSTEPPVEITSMPPVNEARSLSERSDLIQPMDMPPARSLSDRSDLIQPMDMPVLAENMDMPVLAENMDMPRQEE